MLYGFGCLTKHRQISRKYPGSRTLIGLDFETFQQSTSFHMIIPSSWKISWIPPTCLFHTIEQILRQNGKMQPHCFLRSPRGQTEALQAGGAGKKIGQHQTTYPTFYVLRPLAFFRTTGKSSIRTVRNTTFQDCSFVGPRDRENQCS